MQQHQVLSQIQFWALSVLRLTVSLQVGVNPSDEHVLYVSVHGNNRKLGSAAAAVQSGIGNVLRGSVFATLQSAAAGGSGLTAVNTAVQVAGAVIASTSGARAVLRQFK